MFKTTILENRTTLITYQMEHVRSVSLGIWIKSGVITENKDNNGINHFIEHMLFKGTKNISAKEIAHKTDLLGGNINAYTTKENVCLYGKVLDENFEEILEILIEMINDPNFDKDEIIKEKKIIFDEIAMYNDSPEELGYDILCEILYPDSTYGMPILGIKETVNSFQEDTLKKYFNQYFNPSNLIITVAGNFNNDRLINFLKENMGNNNFQNSIDINFNKHNISSGYKYRYKDLEQIHFHIGFKGKKFDDKDSYTMLVLNNILGGSSSSKLFQKIREEFGLAYNIDTQPVFYKQDGFFDLYFSSSGDEIIKSVELICSEINSIKNGEINDYDFNVALSNLKCNYLMGMETSDDYMNFLGKSYYYLDKIISNDEIVREIEKITKEKVISLAKNIFSTDVLGLAVIGKYSENETKNIYDYLKGNII